MKKTLLVTLMILSSIYANDIKSNNFFMSVNYGKLKIYSSTNYKSLKIGYYFYDPNIYLLNNRIYVDISKVNSNAKFYITSLKLDWISNKNSIIKPYLGVSTGYIYYKYNQIDSSTSTYGFQAGIMLDIIKHISLDMSGSWQKAYKKQNIWKKPIKSGEVGLEISF